MCVCGSKKIGISNLRLLNEQHNLNDNLNPVNRSDNTFKIEQITFNSKKTSWYLLVLVEPT